MNKTLLFVLLLGTSVALAEDASPPKRAKSASEAQARKKAKEEAPAKTQEDQKAKEEGQGAVKADPAKEDPSLGMSILGNQEAPKALVIVPWKRSEIGDALGVSTLLDDSRQPVDKEVFMRMLSYYEIRSETAPHGGAPAAGRDTAPAGRNAAQPATAAHRRKS